MQVEGSARAPADEVVTRRNVPGSLAQLVERRGNSRWCRKTKDKYLFSCRFRSGLRCITLVGEVMAHQGYDA